MVQSPETKPYTVGVVGLLGGGKTELAKMLGRLLGARFIDELAPADNPHFQPFYDHLKTGNPHNPHALDSQLTFLDASLKQADIIAAQEGGQVFWVMPPVGHFMYAYLLYESGQLKTKEYITYCKYFVEHVSTAFTPHALIVVLCRDMDILKERIKKRAQKNTVRKGETEVDVGYMNVQNAYWDERLVTQQNYPIAELSELLPQIPMVLLLSDEWDWTTDAGVTQVHDLKLVKEYGILKEAA